MILIADSGSTKTSWRIIDDEKVEAKETVGINPYHQSREEIVQIIAGLSEFSPREIHFYGAGAASETHKSLLSGIFHSTFGVKPVTIESDLLAAARATFKTEPGVICILGTGSNAGLYDGKQVFTDIPSLGYVLGDEGSGAYLGSQFIRALAQGKLSSDLEKTIKKYLYFNTEAILQSVYVDSRPSKYLASFSKHLFQFKDHPELETLISGSFRSFLKIRVQPLVNKKLPISFVGSIAYYYKDALKTECEKMRLSVHQVIKDPIEGLTLYHQKSI